MSASSLDRSPMHLLHRAVQCANDIFLAEVHDLTPRQLAVLMTVAKHAGLSQRAIGVVTCIDRSTTSDIVDRLWRRGLLQRDRKAHDDRAYVVTLTDKGRRMLRAAEPIAKGVDDRVLAALPAGQRERFLGELRSVIDTLDAPVRDL
jgi:DNA-binding MarR family transcriptional regulator